MRQSHITTPRTLADCEFRVGYTEAHTQSKVDQWAEKAVTYTLIFALGFLCAYLAVTA